MQNVAPCFIPNPADPRHFRYHFTQCIPFNTIPPLPELLLSANFHFLEYKNCVYFVCFFLFYLACLFLGLFTAMHHGVISLLGHDTVENTLYGVSLSGRAVLKSTTDHSEKFTAVPKSAWDGIKTKGTTIVAVMVGKDLAITNSTVAPTRINSTNWGGKSLCSDRFFFIL